MEISRNMPEEVKNQKVDGKPRVITIPIPEKILKKIMDKVNLKRKRTQGFFQLSLSIVRAQKQQQQVVDEMASAEQSISNHLKSAHRKLRLNKKPEYQFRFDGKGSFIVVYNPPKPKKEQPKK
jgi:NCAIR mutase (PurE)-related protein